MATECGAEGCERMSACRGYCDMHYRRWKKHGDASIGKIRSAPLDVILEQRSRQDGDCRIWTGAVDAAGYGHKRWNGRPQTVHRLKWISANGPIPVGMVIDHICWNKACINIEHLRLVTHAQNMQYRPGPPSNSTTGVRNVSKSREGTFVVSIKVNEKTTNFGTYSTLDEAARVAGRIRRDMWGEHAGRGKAA